LKERAVSDLKAEGRRQEAGGRRQEVRKLELRSCTILGNPPGVQTPGL